jgi:hypothetical protein
MLSGTMFLNYASPVYGGGVSLVVFEADGGGCTRTATPPY